MLLVLSRGHYGAGVVVVTAVAVNLPSAEAERHTADTDVRFAGGVAHDGGLAVSNLSGHLGGGEAGLCTARAVAGDDLEIRAHLSGTLLGDDAGVLVLGALAPDSGFLLAQESDVAAAPALGGDGATRGRTAEVAR